MPTLAETVPTASLTPAVTSALRAFAPEPLIDCLTSATEPWWRQRACAGALEGRVDDRHAARLLPVVQSPGVTTEVRVALVRVLAQPRRSWSLELLAWLRRLEKPEAGLAQAAFEARAALEDLTVVPHLTVLAADDWRHHRKAGERGLDRLVASSGLEAVLHALGATSLLGLAFDAALDSHRLLGVRLLHQRGHDITRALLDRSTLVAQHAAALLSEASPDDEALDDALLGLVKERGREALWALIVFSRRGRDVTVEWNALGRPTVELPSLPPDVRAAIVRHWVPGERLTDPRWLLEQACADPTTAPDEPSLVRRASAALRVVDGQAPVSAGDDHGQGSGTYFTIETSAGRVAVSTLGPFVRLAHDVVAVRTALEAAGFRVIDEALASLRVDGLHVYFFGAREPLTVLDLLFYWQD